MNCCHAVLLLISILHCQIALAEWTNWLEWSTCSVTCGIGYHVRSRTCGNGASDCTGLNHETKHCSLDPCAVNGDWSDWANWHDCSVTCGSGYQYRHRVCDSPAPAYGGTDCSGSSNEMQMCTNKNLCPVDGGWSSWGGFSECKLCGDKAYKQRFRDCNHPYPANNGADCAGLGIDVVSCPYTDCLDGTWTDWGQWSACSATCGTSVRFKMRSCHVSENKGTCPGNSYESAICKSPCPVDGEWTLWTRWTSCSVSPGCGNGTQERHRLCANPAPAHGGTDCQGDKDQKKDCFISCVVNGQWSNWSFWSKCSATCGHGTQEQHRTCDNPPPSHGGLTCAGSSIHTTSCKMTDCPVDGQWGHWSSYGACSVSCGSGHHTRTRHCDSPAPAHGGQMCHGSSTQTTTCNMNSCVVDGHWGNWGNYGACSVTCGLGHHTRTRHCNNPAPANGGLRCSGSSRQTTSCRMQTCACPSTSWVRYEHSCYYISNGGHTWDHSELYCHNKHAMLAQIDSDGEQQFLVNELKQKYGIFLKDVWIGGTDQKQDGQWVWEDGQKSISTYTNWHTGQPNGRTTENCMAMIAGVNYEWYDKRCNEVRHWVCEKPDTTAGSSLIG